MSHPYFLKNGFIERFEVELKKIIEMEKDKDYGHVVEKVRRKKPVKKVSLKKLFSKIDFIFISR